MFHVHRAERADGLVDALGAVVTRRLSSVRHIADLYDRYSVHRTAMLRGWAEGRDDRWQAELWRRLRERISEPSPAERLEEACARLRAEPALVDLPARVSLFGLTRLPASYLDVLHALAAERDVHLFLLHPSAELWERIASLTRDRPPIMRRAEDSTAALPQNPLLASWGQDAREMQLVLAGGPEDLVVHDHVVVKDVRPTLLGRIQADIRADRTPPGLPLPGASDERMLLGQTIEACRCTPATAARARSMWCVTQSFTSSPMTQRWSRATSSLCAPTSRSSRR